MTITNFAGLACGMFLCSVAMASAEPSAGCSPTTCATVQLPAIGDLNGKSFRAPHGARLFIINQVRLSFKQDGIVQQMLVSGSVQISEENGKSVIRFPQGPPKVVNGAVTVSPGHTVEAVLKNQPLPPELRGETPYEIVP